MVNRILVVALLRIWLHLIPHFCKRNCLLSLVWIERCGLSCYLVCLIEWDYNKSRQANLVLRDAPCITSVMTGMLHAWLPSWPECSMHHFRHDCDDPCITSVLTVMLHASLLSWPGCSMHHFRHDCDAPCITSVMTVMHYEHDDQPGSTGRIIVSDSVCNLLHRLRPHPPLPQRAVGR